MQISEYAHGNAFTDRLNARGRKGREGMATCLCETAGDGVMRI